MSNLERIVNLQRTNMYYKSYTKPFHHSQINIIPFAPKEDKPHGTKYDGKYNKIWEAIKGK